MVLIFNDVYDVLTLDNVAPDVILLDHFIGLTRGIEKIPEFINKWPAVSIAVVSAQKDVKNFSLAYQYGAKTYFSKTPQALEQISKFVSKVNLNKTAEEESNFYQEFLNLFDFNIKSRKNVAIIEDNDVAAFSLQYSLDSDPGLSVSIFVDLFHFLDNPSNLKFDVIILDLNFENCQVHAHEIEKIKQLHPKSSIIVLSANDNLSWAEEVKNSGVDHYIVKSLTGLGRVKELVLSN